MDYPLDLAILALYFVLIAALLYRIRNPLRQCFILRSPDATLFICAAFGAFLLTWYYMIKYFVHSYSQWHHDSSQQTSLNLISHWLHHVSLFDDAWRTVSSGALPWLWSHQLCSFTVAVWTPFLAIEGTRHQIPYLWAYMLLGQVVAISTASALFFAAVLVFPRADVGPSRFLNKTIVLCVAGGMATVVLSPFVADSNYFLPNLLVMHLLLVLPLLPTKPTVSRDNKQAIITAGIYMLSAGTSLAIYMQQVVASYLFLTRSGTTDFMAAMLETFFSHPAQSSISSDVLCVDTLCMMWMFVITSKKGNPITFGIWALMAATPILSAAVTMPMFLAFSELNSTPTKCKA